MSPMTDDDRPITMRCDNCHRSSEWLPNDGSWVGFADFCPSCYAAYWSNDEALLTELRLTGALFDTPRIE